MITAVYKSIGYIEYHCDGKYDYAYEFGGSRYGHSRNELADVTIQCLIENNRDYSTRTSQAYRPNLFEFATNNVGRELDISGLFLYQNREDEYYDYVFSGEHQTVYELYTLQDVLENIDLFRKLANTKLKYENALWKKYINESPLSIASRYCQELSKWRKELIADCNRAKVYMDKEYRRKDFSKETTDKLIHYLHIADYNKRHLSIN